MDISRVRQRGCARQTNGGQALQKNGGQAYTFDKKFGFLLIQHYRFLLKAGEARGSS